MENQTSPPYSRLASIYDEVMVHVNYHQWHRYILEIDRRFGLPSHDVLEIGGGTGKLAALFAEPPWRWFFSDRSMEMAKIARQRLSPSPAGVFLQDARHLSVKSKFGLAVFLYDGINYLETAEGFMACLCEVRTLSPDGGYFLFDVTTEANSKAHFMDYTFFEDLDEAFYVRRSYYEPLSRTQHNRFHIFARGNDNTYGRFVESHSQRLYTLGEITGMVEKAAWKTVGAWDGYGFRKATKSSERVHFLLRKP
jgi:SAM-dependent methyltransferase